MQALGLSQKELVERAALAFLRYFRDRGLWLRGLPVYVFCGPGNNGEDGLALARLLRLFYSARVHVYGLLRESSSMQGSHSSRQASFYTPIASSSEFPKLPVRAIIVDALFGMGLNRPLSGVGAELLSYLNRSRAKLPELLFLAIDIPSGLPADLPPSSKNDPIFRAHYTLSFELPKLSFFFPENYIYVGEWVCVSIGLSPTAMARAKAKAFLLEKTDLYFQPEPPCLSTPLLPEKSTDELQAISLRTRKKLDHKGIYGHALVVGGSLGKVGAPLLAAKAALRSGCGLVSCLVPACAISALHSYLPEAMGYYSGDHYVQDFHAVSDRHYILVGPGLSTETKVQHAFLDFLQKAKPSYSFGCRCLKYTRPKPRALCILASAEHLNTAPQGVSTSRR